MKNLVFVGLLVVVFSAASTAWALRCDNGLVDVGNSHFEVLKTCGAPVSKEVVGYTLTRDGKRELKMEHWVYGPINGYYYILIFEGGFLKEVNDFRSP